MTLPKCAKPLRPVQESNHQRGALSVPPQTKSCARALLTLRPRFAPAVPLQPEPTPRVESLPSATCTRPLTTRCRVSGPCVLIPALSTAKRHTSGLQVPHPRRRTMYVSAPQTGPRMSSDGSTGSAVPVGSGAELEDRTKSQEGVQCSTAAAMAATAAVPTGQYGAEVAM